jgi:hypothetical protein
MLGTSLNPRYHPDSAHKLRFQVYVTALMQRTIIRVPCNGGNPSKLKNPSALLLGEDIQYDLNVDFHQIVNSL